MKHALVLLSLAACADEVVIRDVAPSKVRDRSAASQEAHDATPLETPPKRKRAVFGKASEAEAAAAVAPPPLPNIVTVLQEPKSFCKNLGPFVGIATRRLDPSFTFSSLELQEDLLAQQRGLVEDGVRDAMRRVAAAGGNYIQLSAPQYMAFNGYTNGVSVLSIGFTCADAPK